MHVNELVQAVARTYVRTSAHVRTYVCTSVRTYLRTYGCRAQVVKRLACPGPTQIPLPVPRWWPELQQLTKSSGRTVGLSGSGGMTVIPHERVEQAGLPKDLPDGCSIWRRQYTDSDVIRWRCRYRHPRVLEVLACVFTRSTYVHVHSAFSGSLQHYQVKKRT